MDLGLSGRRALVTGSYRGTGAGIARALAAEGAHVVVHGFEPGQPDEVVAGIVESGGSAEGVVGDLLGNDVAWLDSCGRVDMLVNNFGRPEGSTWRSAERWDEAWNSNVMTAMRPTVVLADGMRERGWGRIVVLGTVGRQIPGRRNPAYYTAKAGLHAFVRSLAQELRGTGVTANLVSPGMIATAEVVASITRRAERDGITDPDEAIRRALSTTMPNLTERLPTPEDIGAVVAFVCSTAAWHVNGADIAVDGGAVDAR